MNRLVYSVSCSLFYGCLRLLWRVRYHGAENVPRSGPVLLIANHASFLDPMLAGCGFGRRVRFLARDSLARVPILGRWMRAVGVIFISREAPGRAAINRSAEALARGEVVCLFPEGTRSTTGAIGPFRRGAQLLVKKSGAVVVPAGISGSFRALPPGRWLPRLFCRCEVSYGSPLSAAEVQGSDGLLQLRRSVAQLSGLALAEVRDPSPEGRGHRRPALVEESGQSGDPAAR